MNDYSPHFTLNLTLFNRLPLHLDVDKIIGDFTSSTLLEVDNRGQDSLTNRCRKIQEQLWQDLDHRYVSGVEILRELARNRQQVTGALMPVVFTSTLTQDDTQSNNNNRPWQAETVYSLSQTSQVYLDHQVGERDGELVFNWDAIDELFPNGVLDDMFTVYCNFLQQLALKVRSQESGVRSQKAESRSKKSEKTAWNDIRRDLLPAYQKELFKEVNATEFDFQADNPKLQNLFFAKAAENPQQIAVIADNYTLTYQDNAIALSN